MKQFVISLFLAFGIFSVALVGPADAQQVWIQVESQKSIKDTRDRAQFFAARFPDTRAFLTTTGWYAIVIGPMEADQARDTLSRLVSNGQIPRDSLISDGGPYLSQLWPLTSANDTSTANTPPAQTETASADDTPAAQEATETAEQVAEPALKPDPDLNASKAMERGWSREDKMLYQTYMVWTGDYDSGIDGAYGRGTRTAISLFQERNGFEPTGYLSAEQIELLASRYTDKITRLGVDKVRDLDAGIEILMPTKLVHFTGFEPPFVHYGAIDGGQVQVSLISQKGDRNTLNSLYDIMSTLPYVPAEGYRVNRRDWFVLSGRDADIVSYTYVRLERGLLKGFTLVWTPEMDKDMQPLATAMYDSFAPIQDYVLDETIGGDTGSDGPADLTSGLDTPSPDHSESGFWVNAQGVAVAHMSAANNCRSITTNDGDVTLLVTATDPAAELVVLSPKSPFTPPAFALFSNEEPERGTPVSIAGFSFPEVMTVAALNYGTLTDTDGTLGDQNQIRVSAYLEDGDIGGPVLDDRGAVIAMQMRRDDDHGNLPDSVNFALKSRVITDFLTAQNIRFGHATSFDAVDPVDMAYMAGEFTVKLSCWK